MDSVFNDIPAELEDQLADGPGFLDPENYAAKVSVRRRVKEELLSRLDQVRSQRAKIEDRWSRLNRLYDGKTDTRLYEGESDIHVAMSRKIVQTFISQVTTQIFPTNQLFEVSDTNPMTPDPTTKIAVQALVEHDVEQCKLRSKMPFFLQRGLILGPSIVKVQWRCDSTQTYRRTAVPRGFTPEAGYDVGFEETELKHYDGPTFDVVDVLRWYIHPITSRSVEDAEIIFEDISVDRNHLNAMARKDIYDPKFVKKLLKIPPSDTKSRTDIVDSNRSDRINSSGYSIPDSVKDNRYRLTEIWAKFDLYGDGREVPCKIVACGDIILEVRQNPFLHQKPPYLAWRVDDKIDDFYGTGLIEPIEPLAHTFNALINSGIDNANWQMHPMMIINKAQLASSPSTMKIAPRQAIYTWTDPRQAISFERPPETYNISFQVGQLVAGMMQDIAGSPPIMQGEVGNRTQTATEADILARGAGAFTNIMASKIEADVLSPWLQMVWMLEQQFRMDSTMLRITGQDPQTIRLDPHQIVGDYKFVWNVSTGAAQRMQIQQARGGMTAAPGAPTAAEQGGAIPPDLQGMG